MKTTDETDDVLSSAALQVAAARIRITELRPYISHALFAITTRPLPGLGTIGVDRHWRLVYDPATVVTWTVPEVAGVLYHEVWHLLRDHAGRAAGRDAQVWNLACDAEINDDLRDEMKDDRRPGGPAFLLPGQPVLPASFGMPDGLTAEEYYDQLVKEQAPQPGGAIPQSGGASPRSGGAIPQPDGATPQSGGGATPQSGGATPQPGGATGSASGEALNSTQRDVASGRCGSAATGVAEPWEATFDGDDQSPGAGKVDAQDTRISPGEARVIRGVVAEAIVRNRGTVPGHALLHAERELAPARVDWRAELRSVIARTIATVAGAIDYSYARPSRRQSALGNVIMPSLREPVVRVAIIADTSGSMGSDYGKVLREIETIIKGFGRNDAVPVFSVDAAVHTRQRVRNVAEVQLIGGGGTDMRLGIGEAYTLRPRPDVAVVLTDGYTPWPDIPPPGMRVVAGIIGGTCQGVPGWMRTVLIDASG